jgi:hypothetical protein
MFRRWTEVKDRQRGRERDEKRFIYLDGMRRRREGGGRGEREMGIMMDGE